MPGLPAPWLLGFTSTLRGSVLSRSVDEFHG